MPILSSLPQKSKLSSDFMALPKAILNDKYIAIDHPLDFSTKVHYLVKLLHQLLFVFTLELVQILTSPDFQVEKFTIFGDIAYSVMLLLRFFLFLWFQLLVNGKNSLFIFDLIQSNIVIITADPGRSVR